jgi:hypothetical protein
MQMKSFGCSLRGSKQIGVNSVALIGVIFCQLDIVHQNAS